MTNLNQEKLEISDIIAHVNRAVDFLEAGRDAETTGNFLKRLVRMLETQEEEIDTELFLTYEEEQDEELFDEYVKNSQTKTLREWVDEENEDQEIRDLISGWTAPKKKLSQEEVDREMQNFFS